MKKKIVGVVSVGRSDAGIYQSVLSNIQNSKLLDLRLYVTGGHLASEFGNTWQDFEKTGIPIYRKIVSTLASDTPEAISKSIALTTLGFAESFADSTPDCLLILGDRYEMMGAALAAMPFVLPIGHIHGGETTEGAIDEAIRHSLTKLSHVHFATTEAYGNRIIQLGEEPWRVHVVGAPALDTILNSERLCDDISFDTNKPFILCTYHPVTLEYKETAQEFQKILNSLQSIGLPVIFTYPNTDTNGRLIIKMIKEFLISNKTSLAFDHLGIKRYSTLMHKASVVVGNSSSGIIEAGSFPTPVVNIGDRQKGRICGKNVISTACVENDIVISIRKALSLDFKNAIKEMENPYGDGNAAVKIVEVLENLIIDQRLTMKKFHDLNIKKGH